MKTDFFPRNAGTPSTNNRAAAKPIRALAPEAAGRRDLRPTIAASGAAQRKRARRSFV